MKLLGLALLMAVSPAWAQFGSAGAPPTMQGWGRAPVNATNGLRPGRPIPGSRSNVVFLGEPWLDSYSAPPGQTTYIVLQPQATPKAEEPPRPITPLLIEWRGDRFVRTTSDSSVDKSGDLASTEPAQKPLPAKAKEVEPVVLVFRDGHREMVRDYSIVGGSLYTSADYVQSGSWTKAIRLSALDLPATLELNRSAGFELPSGPNVVVTRF